MIPSFRGEADCSPPVSLFFFFFLSWKKKKKSPEGLGGSECLRTFFMLLCWLGGETIWSMCSYFTYSSKAVSLGLLVLGNGCLIHRWCCVLGFWVVSCPWIVVNLFMSWKEVRRNVYYHHGSVTPLLNPVFSVLPFDSLTLVFCLFTHSLNICWRTTIL